MIIEARGEGHEGHDGVAQYFRDSPMLHGELRDQRHKVDSYEIILQKSH